MNLVCEIITVGNEILLGHTVDTNAAWLGLKLQEAGLYIQYHQTVPDFAPAIEEAITLSRKRSGIVVCTGGLGPTDDDLTKRAIIGAFGMTLRFRDDLMKEVRARFDERDAVMPAINESQALFPSGAEPLHNTLGTAAGILVTQEDFLFAALPGVPKEMKHIFEQELLPLLHRRYARARGITRIFRTTGIPESAIQEQLYKRRLPKGKVMLAFLPSFHGVDLQVTVPVGIPDGKLVMEDVAQLMYELFGDVIYTEGDEKMEAVIGRLLKAKGKTVSVAESCTGGLLAKRLTDTPGSSAYFLGGVVAYSNPAKTHFLGVTEEVLANFGAVSDKVALEMALGCRKVFGTDYALSVTGIAGPEGATETKSVGMVHIGLATPNGAFQRQYKFGGDREMIRERAGQAALEMLRRDLA